MNLFCPGHSELPCERGLYPCLSTSGLASLQPVTKLQRPFSSDPIEQSLTTAVAVALDLGGAAALHQLALRSDGPAGVSQAVWPKESLSDARGGSGPEAAT